MKKLNVLVYLIAACLLYLTVNTLVASRDSVAVEKETPVVMSFVNSVEIPASIHFCGKNIDLLRYNMREGLDRELSSLTYQHSTTMLLIKRANRYFPVIEPILKKNNIPDDFKYLAVIESSLEPKAESAARAVGMWQMLESTAKSYGLTVNLSVDERRNVEKSTEAACKYLKEAYSKYGDWVTVASSYNGGMARISGQIAKQYESSSLNLYLASETTRYPFRIFAAKMIFENPFKYGFVLRAENLYAPMDCKEVAVNNDIPDLIAYAKNKDITYNDLKFFNPWLKDTKLITGGKQFKILIPNRNMLYYDNNYNTYVHDSRWVVQ
ncbi:MAG: lytic transglycosylase domain-containing protein [Tannerella sp.]|jgi:hypothetical protein|nr:lytic transglycosylase domain-containing protein [Tannerella sp.]